MKVLVISNTYSLPKYPAKGLFVKEQALCLVEGNICDIDVAFIERKSSPFVKCFSTFLRRLIFRKLNLVKIDEENRFKCFYFLIPINRRIPDFIQIKFENFYINLFEKEYLNRNDCPKLIHAHNGHPSGVFAFKLSKSWNCSYVITEHSPLLFNSFSKERGDLIISSFTSAKKVASLTKFQDQLLRRYSYGVNSMIIPNLSNERKFIIEFEIKKPKIFTIISVLYALPVKGREYLFKSLKLLKDRKIYFKFILIGEGIDKMKAECKKLDIFDLGEFYYNISNDQMYKYYNRAHVFVCSSIYETHGMAARGAMLSGLPIVTTDNSGVGDSITPKTGVIVPVQNGEALADGIQSVYKNYEQYNPDYIRNYVIDQSGIEKFSMLMADFYGIPFNRTF